MGRYVALLRGINVGGKNIIKMTDLKACFEKQGFTDVGTYIQSGNVVFTAVAKEAVVEQKIAVVLAKTFAYEAALVVRSLSEMRTIVGKAPEGFGGKAAKYRYNVLFLMPPLTGATVVKLVPCREGVDEVWAGRGVLYHARLEAKATQSYLSKVVAMPIYQRMTIRNWNTTTALLRMMESSST
ncbi:MAG: DUF1697 domain-containing protein [Kofleriaceae bacterium]|nr:DUF1697 domain-containing protein [Kofleriaceae bacterium]